MKPVPAVAALLLVACSTTPAIDDGLKSLAVPFAVAPAKEALLPAPPVLTPCPPGWVERAGTPAACEPWRDDLPQRCAADEAHLVGTPACARVGTACTGDDWVEPLPAGRPILYVKAGAPAGGSGSRASPFATLAQAVAGAPGGTVIALSKGTHAITVPIPGGIAVWGACVGQTTVLTNTLQAAVTANQPGVEVRNLRVTGPRGGLLVEGAAATLDVENVIVDAAAGAGLLALSAGQVAARNLVIRVTASVGGNFGRAVLAQEGSQVSLTRAVLAGNRDTAVSASDPGTRVTLVDSAVLDTTTPGAVGTGRGVLAQQQAQVELTRVMVAGNLEVGVLALSGGAITLTDVVVRDTHGLAGKRGEGISAQDAAVTGTRVRASNNTNSGVSVDGSTATLTLSDVLVEDTTFNAGDITGVGVSAVNGGRATLERASVTRSVGSGLVPTSGGSLSLTDVEIRDTFEVPNPTTVDHGGEGLSVVLGGRVNLNRVRVVGNHTIGVVVLSEGSVLSGTDLSILDTRADANGRGGAGLVMGQGAAGALERVHVDSSRTGGVDVRNAGTRLEVKDLRITRTLPEESGGQYGQGLVVANGGTVTGERVEVRGSQLVGVVADGVGASATLAEATIAQTRYTTCGGLPACAGLVASGIAALGGGRLVLRRFLVTDNAGIGVLQASGGQLDLSDGEVSFQDVGANVLDVGFDLARISTGVAYRSNAQKLVSTFVPLPPIAPPLK